MGGLGVDAKRYPITCSHGGIARGLRHKPGPVRKPRVEVRPGSQVFQYIDLARQLAILLQGHVLRSNPQLDPFTRR